MSGATGLQTPIGGIPVLRPGVDPIPLVCPSCGSTMLDPTPPLGRDRFEPYTCHNGHTLAFLKPPLRRIVVRERPDTLPLVVRPDAPPAPRVEGDWRTVGCGPACRRGRCDGPTHEQYGRAVERGYALVRQARPRGVVRTGPIEVDYDRRAVRVDGQDVGATPTEFLVLAVLALELGRCVLYEDLIVDVWGLYSSTPRVEAGKLNGTDETHMLSVAMARLRARLGTAGRLIETVKNQGYLLADVPARHTEG